MTYDTPTLLLVGAAQSLVLEVSDPSLLEECVRRDNAKDLISDVPELW